MTYRPDPVARDIATPPVIVIKLQILERRMRFIDQLEAYNKLRFKGAGVSISNVKATLTALYHEVGAAIASDFPDEENKALKKQLNSNNYTDLYSVWEKIDTWLLKKRLTKFDLRKDYDSTDVEAENEAYGL